MSQRPVRPRRPLLRPVPLPLVVALVAGLVALANPAAVASPSPLPASPRSSYPPVTTSVYETGTWAAANQKKMKFWGVLSQYVSGRSCGLSATQGYDALLAALNGDASTTQTSIPYLSDIACGSAQASASLPTAGRG